MLYYLKFVATWVLFMVILGVITLLVPKIAAKIDKIRKNTKKETEKPFPLKQNTYMTPISEDELKETATEEEK